MISFEEKKSLIPATSQTKPIETYLVFAPQNPKSNAGEIIQEPELTPDLPHTKQPPVNEPQIQPKTIAHSLPPIIKPDQQEQLKNNTQTEESADVENSTKAELETKTETIDSNVKNTQPSTQQNTIRPSSALNATSKYLNSLNQNALNSMIDNQGQRILQEHANPIIETGEISTLTEDEKFRKSFTKQINCKNYLNKAIGVLSGVTGGTLKCSELPNFQEYINKHKKGNPQ